MTTFQTGAAVLTFVASTVSGWLFVDDRFAHSNYVAQEIGTMQEQFTRQDIRQIDRDIFALKQEAERRSLSSFEKERLRQLQNERAQLERKLQGR
jgi:membrane protein involved in colicin uptake